MTKRPLRPDEQSAWARVTRSVKALRPDTALDAAAKSDMQTAFEAVRSGKETPEVYTPVALPRTKTNAASMPANRGNEKRVRRGRAPIAARFDLHGHTQASADAALPAFLMRERAGGAKCVLVITGKGKSGEGVLKRNFLHWLETPAARIIVSGYAEAHRKHGGAGAFYVFLRRL